MASQSRMVQIGYVAAAIGLLTAAGGLEGPIEEIKKQYDIAPDAALARQYPDVTVLSYTPGGLRGLLISYLWISTTNLQRRGRFYDAMQRSTLICRLQPRFPNVWSQRAKIMAYDIVASLHTDEERWLWLTNGIKLARDEGLAFNPRGMELYQDLAFIYFFKIGGYLDDSHVYYKQRLAKEMQDLLGSPPPGTTDEVVEAFRPIALAARQFLDKRPELRGAEDIQAGQLKALLADTGLRACADDLAKLNVQVGPGLLEEYNRLSLDEPAEITRAASPALATRRDRELSDLINSPARAEALKRLLAFVRAQLLWNRHNLDPEWMLGLMEGTYVAKINEVVEQSAPKRADGKVKPRALRRIEGFKLPLDWRTAHPHGLYWITRGVVMCGEPGSQEFYHLNANRVALDCLKTLTWEGKLTYVENPEDPKRPDVNFVADLRYVQPVHLAHLHAVDLVYPEERQDQEENKYLWGHVNYMRQAIELLYACYRHEEAQRYLAEIRKEYDLKGEEWDQDAVRDFVLISMGKQYGHEKPAPIAAFSYINSALQAAFILFSRGRSKEARQCWMWAQSVKERYTKGPVNVELPSLRQFELDNAVSLLIEPRSLGYRLDLAARKRLFDSLPGEMKLHVYGRIIRAEKLRRLCEAEGVTFDAIFAKPDGWEAFLKRQQDQVAPRQPEIR